MIGSSFNRKSTCSYSIYFLKEKAAKVDDLSYQVMLATVGAGDLPRMDFDVLQERDM